MEEDTNTKGEGQACPSLPSSSEWPKNEVVKCPANAVWLKTFMAIETKNDQVGNFGGYRRV